MSPPKEFDPESLKRQRQEKGFSVDELALISNVSIASIQNYEAGRSNPSSKIWKKLQKALNRKCTSNINKWRKPPKEKIPVPVTFSFESGHIYTINDVRCNNNRSDFLTPHNGYRCIFKYIGREGIHHVFIEVRGGWTRTYTDAQLIGKKIEEAKHEQA